jgi:hypothetical protein
LPLAGLGLLPVLAALPACAPLIGDDDDDGSGNDFGGLDVDGDGALTPEDLQAGEVAAYVDLTDAGEDAAAFLVSNARIEEAVDGFWYIEGDFGGVEGYALSLRFYNGYPLSVGEGEISNATFGNPAGELYSYTSETAATVEVTAASATSASGQLDGALTLDVYEMDVPNGETVTIEAAAFRDAEIVVTDG